MQQLPLLASNDTITHLATHISRDRSILLIPEGIDTTQCTHGMHRFAGKFIPNIARHIIRTYLPPGPDAIFDPFCGSGTTLVEAALEGRRFLGMDIDPLSVLIADAKTTLLAEDELQQLEDYWARHDYSKIDLSLVPGVPNLSHWFSLTATRQLTSLKRRALVLPERLRRFSLVVFSSILRRVSNADDQTQKTYVSHTLPKTPRLPADLFPLQLARALNGMREYSAQLPFEPSGSVILADARSHLPHVPVQHILTSPPYIDSIDYPYNQMLEYYWLLDELGLHTHDAYRRLRKEPMGFTHYDPSAFDGFADRYFRESSEAFEGLCDAISQKSPKEELAVRSFFLDYAAHASRALAFLPRSGRYVCIVGDSTIRGTVVPTTSLVTLIHLALGFVLEDRVTYSIRRHYMKFPRRANSGTISMDTILVFQREA